MPRRMTEGSVGYDLSIRAIVHPSEKDPQNKCLRRTIFDFENMPDDPLVRAHVQKIPKEDGRLEELVYRMASGEHILVGVGFVCDMPFPLVQLIMPRSGLASRWGIVVRNAPGTIDPDY